MSDTTKAILLEHMAMLMSRISEDCYAAGWILHHDHAIFGMVFDGSTRSYGTSAVLPSEIDTLRHIAQETQQWYDGNDFVPLAEFGRRYADMKESTDE